MAQLAATLLFKGDLAAVAAVVCRCGRSGGGEEEWVDVPRIGLPRSGVFAIHRAAGSGVVDPTVAVVFGADESYRVSHPLDGGDQTLALAFRPDLHEEAFAGVHGGLARVDAQAQMGAALLASRLARGEFDALQAEEVALALLDSLSRARRDGSAASATERRRADEVRVLVAADPARAWRLDGLARAVGCSPFHLARQFRAAAGETIAQHVLRARMTIALDRLAEGEDDLARLAVDLGFAHHSHFTARFRSLFGVPPSQARRAARS